MSKITLLYGTSATLIPQRVQHNTQKHERVDRQAGRVRACIAEVCVEGGEQARNTKQQQQQQKTQINTCTYYTETETTIHSGWTHYVSYLIRRRTPAESYSMRMVSISSSTNKTSYTSNLFDNKNKALFHNYNKQNINAY